MFAELRPYLLEAARGDASSAVPASGVSGVKSGAVVADNAAQSGVVRGGHGAPELPQVVANQQVRHDLAFGDTMVYKSSAERAGFEPAVRGYRTQHFQCCLFNHSSTAPVRRSRRSFHFIYDRRRIAQKSCHISRRPSVVNRPGPSVLGRWRGSMGASRERP